MRSLTITAGLVALLGLLLAPGACKQTDSILLVYVSGPKSLTPQQLLVNVSSGSDARAINVPTMPGPIVLPASFTIALDRSHVAPITVTVNALDGNAAPCNFAGTTMMDHINIGGQTDVAVELVFVPPPDQIGGGPGMGSTCVPVGGGGGEGGGSGGAGGGAGGASGQDGSADADDGGGGASGQDADDGGGASGQDGAADAADVMGLDTAAD